MKRKTSFCTRLGAYLTATYRSLVQRSKIHSALQSLFGTIQNKFPQLYSKAMAGHDLSVCRVDRIAVLDDDGVIIDDGSSVRAESSGAKILFTDLFFGRSEDLQLIDLVHELTHTVDGAGIYSHSPESGHRKNGKILRGRDWINKRFQQGRRRQGR